MNKIKVFWTDDSSCKRNSRQIYLSNLSSEIEDAENEGWFSKPYLQVNIKLDIKGDGSFIIENNFNFKIN